MKRFRLSMLVTCLLTGLLYFSCQKNVHDALPENKIGNIPAGDIVATVTGRILDDAGKPVSGATVTAGAVLIGSSPLATIQPSTTTDIDGRFILKDITLNKNAAFVKVDKAGFFTGSRTFTVYSKKENNISIQLLRKLSAGAFEASTGGELTVQNGGKITIAPGSVIDAATKSIYTGKVEVVASFINPALPVFQEIMPGALRGYDEEGKETGLQSFGMIAVELAGDKGVKLQLAPGKPATLSLPIPVSLQPKAPATIPFWSFNDTLGLWKKEGTATRQGNYYIGKASHFSFWNADTDLPLVEFKIILKQQNGDPVVKARVWIVTTEDENNTAGYGFTDETGLVSGKIPAGKLLRLSARDACGQMIVGKEIGPFNSNTDLGTVTVDNSAAATLVFTGTVVNCSGNPVLNGHVNIVFDGRSGKAAIKNGSFTYSFIRCSNETKPATFRAVDADALMISNEGSIDVTAGGTLDAGQLNACSETVDEYVVYSLDGEIGIFAPPADRFFDDLYEFPPVNKRTLQSVASDISPGNPSQLIIIDFLDEYQAPVVHKGNFVWLYQYPNRGYSTGVKPYKQYNLNITGFGPKNGGYIEGNASVMIRDTYDPLAIDKPMKVTFRFKRKS